MVFRVTHATHSQNSMDKSQIAQFTSRYSSMRGDELIYLLAAKFEHLTEEAQHALKEVAARRGIGDADAEVKATTVDLAAQAQYEEAERRKAEARKATERKVVLVLCGSFTGIGLGMAALGNSDAGWTILAVALLAAVAYEVRRLLGKVVAAMFTNPTK